MLLEILILICAVPAGYLISYLTKEELVAGRKWFVAIIIISFLTGLLFFMAKNYVITWTAGFVIIATFISLIKGYDKKWTKRKN